MAKKQSLFEHFLKKGNKIGSITPSSKFLVRKMLDPIDFSRDLTIIELGVGTGNITKSILEEMSRGSKLLAFEINTELCDQFRAEVQDERLLLINDSAEHLARYLHEAGHEKADYIICSLPLAIIEKAIEERIMDAAVDVLRPEGAFIYFQYSLASFKKIRNRFRDVKTDFTPYNIPPAFVFVCRV